MSQPFHRLLKDANPGAAVHVLCKSSLADLYRGNPWVDDVLPFEPNAGPFSLAQRVRGAGFDSGFVLPPSFSAALALAWAGVPRRVGYRTDFRGFLLTEAKSLDERFHYVRRYLGLLGEEGRDVGPGDFYFPRPADERDDARAFLRAAGVDADAPFLAVAPGSQAPARRWFPERFAALIDRVPAASWRAVVLLGAPSDIPSADEVAAHARRPVINLCGKTGLALLGDVLRRARALVTNESGMMHVAWAVGTPTVVLAGPSEPRLTSPFGARSRVLQHREVSCVPCVKNECWRAAEDYKECMSRLSAGEAAVALEGLLRDVETLAR